MTRKGRAKAFDHNSLASIMWLRFAELGVEVRVERVPSEENIADLPSRECYGLLERMGAQMVPFRWAVHICIYCFLVGRRIP